MIIITGLPFTGFQLGLVTRVLAQNENGEDSASILVTVTAPPSPPGQPVVIDIAGTTCVLRCLVSQIVQSYNFWLFLLRVGNESFTDGSQSRTTEALT